MKGRQLSDSLSRTVKLAIDTGEAATIQEAQRIFQGYRLAIEVGPDVRSSATLQAALLTAVNSGRRCFLGGVQVAGITDAPLLLPWRHTRTLSEAVHDLCGTLADRVVEGIPRILIGDVPHPAGTGDFAVQATFNGWSGGVVPHDTGVRLHETQEFIPAGVLAGALGISEAFQYIRGGNPMAGRRNIGLSLWQPTPANAWMAPKDFGPALRYLPSELWLIGLGHLGQAFLWTLGLLPYARPEDVSLILQDFDFLTPANESTSLLTFAPVALERKTRAIARWCEGRGFRTRIVERRFGDDFRVSADEPTVGICGVDNALARSAIESVGFERVIEAGLGKGDQNYLAFQIHTFPGPQKARDRWSRIGQLEETTGVNLPAYQALASEGLDECGIVSLAGRSVGASFVGTACAALMLAEVLRMIHCGPSYALVDGSLRAPGNLQAHENTMWQEPFNPGVTTP